MAGLIEALGFGTGDPSKDDALNNGILQAGLQMMASRGTLRQALGQGGMAGMQGYEATRDNQWQGQQRAQQQRTWDEQNRQMAQQQKLRELAPQFQRSATQNAMAGGGGPTLANAQNLQTAQPSFDWDGYIKAVEGVDPMRALELRSLTTKDNTELLSEGQTRFDKRTGKAIYGNPKAPTIPNDVREYEYAKAQGYGGSFEQWDHNRKRAGASNVTVKTDVKTGESLASQVGPMMKDSALGAEAAVKQVDAAQRIARSVDSNKMFVGTGANIKLKATQLADMLGIAGRDDTEKLANTRQAIRGLAELTLQGRQQMKGQGAITESEGRLAEKAMSGDISDLTAGELKQLAQASERAARFNHAQHERKMAGVRGRREFDGVSTFYEAPPMPAEYLGGGGGNDPLGLRGR